MIQYKTHRLMSFSKTLDRHSISIVLYCKAERRLLSFSKKNLESCIREQDKKN